MKTKCKKYGWDKNLMIYRCTTKGEKTRGLIIQNPKKMSTKKAVKLAKRSPK